MAKILVTGGNGFIGSHTVVELLTEGHEVIVVDNLCNSKAYVQDRIAEITGKRPQFYQVDICDADAFSCVFSEHPDLDGIIHFAAHLFVEESVSNPLKYYQNNLNGLLNLIDLANGLNRTNIVFSSSCTVYGNPDNVPISESESIKSAVSPYGNTKKIAEEILFDCSRAMAQLKVISLRYFNPIGAHGSGRMGEDPIGHHTHLVPIISEVAAGRREKLMVFGDDYPTRDGTCVRDYIHVVDLAKAHVLAVNRLLNENMESSYEVYNLGSGLGQTVLEVVGAFERATGKKVAYQIAPRRPGDAAKVYADIGLAQSKLGWKPEKSIDDMLSSTFDWEIANSRN